MEHYKLILPEHLNHHGYLFGGYMLKWIDEFAYITANQEFPGNNFVTVALDNVVFRQRVNSGEIVKFLVERAHLGNTSVQYAVKAFGTRHNARSDDIIFETKITFVAVDTDGNKQVIKQAEAH
jgi:acyl-CoA hydrolase